MTNKQLAVNVGERNAEHLFFSMLNPKHRGGKFTWEKLPEMAGGLAHASLGLSVSHWVRGKKLELLRKKAKTAAIKKAQHLISEYTFSNGPLPIGKPNE